MPFPHRINSDGTIDSICDQCFATVGISASDSDLKQLEAAHICEPARVAYYHQIEFTAKRPPAKDRGTHPASKARAVNTRGYPRSRS